MSHVTSRRTFVWSASCLLAAAQAGRWLSVASAADAEPVIVDTSAGKVRGFMNGDIKTFKGIPYGASTAGKNRFMPPVKMPAWTGIRDAMSFGPSAPQATQQAGSAAESEDCLVLNVFTPGVDDQQKRPVMVCCMEAASARVPARRRSSMERAWPIPMTSWW